MALNARNYKNESTFERPDPLEAGSYPARVVWIISRGLQAQDDFKGEEKPPKHELYVVYELQDEFLKDEEGEDIEDKPRFLNEKFTMNSLESDKAKSTMRYLALDPTLKFDGDWSKLIGTPCVLTVVQNKSKKGDNRVYNNIKGVSSMRDKDAKKAVPLVNEPKVFDIDEPDIEVFLSLPKWLQSEIKENLEFEGSILQEKLENVSEEEDEPKKKSKSSNKMKSKPDPEPDNDEDDDDEKEW